MLRREKEMPAKRKKDGQIVRSGRTPIGGARLREAAMAMRQQSRHEVLSDVNGSYTGTPADYEKPEQDADDL